MLKWKFFWILRRNVIKFSSRTLVTITVTASTNWRWLRWVKPHPFYLSKITPLQLNYLPLSFTKKPDLFLFCYYSCLGYFNTVCFTPVQAQRLHRFTPERSFLIISRSFVNFYFNSTPKQTNLNFFLQKPNSVSITVPLHQFVCLRFRTVRQKLKRCGVKNSTVLVKLLSYYTLRLLKAKSKPYTSQTNLIPNRSGLFYNWWGLYLSKIGCFRGLDSKLVRYIVNSDMGGRFNFIPIVSNYMPTYFTAYVNKFFSYTLNSRTTTLVNFELYFRLSKPDVFVLESIKARLIHMSSAFSTVFFVNEFLDLLFLIFKTKSIHHIPTYLNRILKSLIIWDHKPFLVFVFEMIREQFLPLFNYFGVYGFTLSVRGKIGVGGNSRKRRMVIKVGKTSSNITSPNAYYFNSWLNTRTGALGLKFSLVYRTPKQW